MLPPQPSWCFPNYCLIAKHFKFNNSFMVYSKHNSLLGLGINSVIRWERRLWVSELAFPPFVRQSLCCGVIRWYKQDRCIMGKVRKPIFSLNVSFPPHNTICSPRSFQSRHVCLDFLGKLESTFMSLKLAQSELLEEIPESNCLWLCILKNDKQILAK